MSFEIKLPHFEGPFDLLLFFIERDELDIHNIPIAKITADFLDYLHTIRELNMELAGEFILVAASLMRIKAKILLPRPDLDEQGKEIDPRQDLVQKLIEYKKYKTVIEDLKNMEEERGLQSKRGSIPAEMKSVSEISNPENELLSLSLYKLLMLYNKAMTRFSNTSTAVIHTIEQYPYTIEGQKSIILGLFEFEKTIQFEDLINISSNRIHLIYNFLAVLELLQQQIVDIYEGITANHFYIQLKNIE